MTGNLRSPAPLPMRLVFGVYFAVTGFCHLGGLGLCCLPLGEFSKFLGNCHHDLIRQLADLGVRWTWGVGAGIGLVEFFGGLGQR